jgi:ATP-binding cassette, subfamily C (CFTR/MRP), member 1
MLTYHWLSPIMTLGYQRTLQATDLWKMDPSRESSLLSRRFDESWARRSKAAQEWNERLSKGEISPSLKLRVQWVIRALLGGPSLEERKRNWQLKGGRKEASIAWALNDVLGREFWAGGLFKVVGDTSQLMGPLIVKVCPFLSFVDSLGLQSFILYRLSSRSAKKERVPEQKVNHYLILVVESGWPSVSSF